MRVVFVQSWAMRFRRTPSGGELAVQLDRVVSTMSIEANRLGPGASFDRFGLLNFQPDGKPIDVFFDDLTYTADR